MKAPAEGMDTTQIVRQEPQVFLAWQPTRPPAKVARPVAQFLSLLALLPQLLQACVTAVGAHDPAQIVQARHLLADLAEQIQLRRLQRSAPSHPLDQQISHALRQLLTHLRAELGILRSIGARKKDVSRVFNAENFLIGIFAGGFGILITYLLEIPANILGNQLLGISTLAELNVGYAFLLILISIVLSLLSGLIPAKKAAKQDPVVALRTE